jgi:hypothetical protein
MNDLKFTTAGEYMSNLDSQIDETTGRPYFINESGLKIDADTGELIQTVYPGPQCSPP